MTAKTNPPSPRSPRGRVTARKTVPYLSHAPWSGFLGKERKRKTPLAACPSDRCKRANKCIAAYENVFCQRTHLPFPKPKKAKPSKKRLSDAGLQKLMLRVELAAEKRAARVKKLTDRWKKGEFDELFGPYTTRGVLIPPPPKLYADDHGQSC